MDRARVGRAPTLLIARRLAPTGSSASRRATLPVDAVSDLIAAADAIGEPIVPISTPSRVAYAPELVWRPAREPESPTTSGPTAASSATGTVHSRAADRHAFETLFAREADPWRYESRYEQEKYDRTLEVLPARRFRSALEVGCAEGHFTARLAPRVDRLVAADISQIALQRAAQRCEGLSDVSFILLDIASEAPPGRFDLIVCGEVLYYVGGRRELNACARRLTRALEPGGYLVSVHANVLVDEPDEHGFVWDLPFGAKGISETLSAVPLLRPLAAAYALLPHQSLAAGPMVPRRYRSPKRSSRAHSGCGDAAPRGRR